MSFNNLHDENGDSYITEVYSYSKAEADNKFQSKITGATGTFQTPDGKTVTVTNGIITSIQ